MSIALHTLPKLVRTAKRRGRGVGSGGAKSGRGMKGQKSRAGARLRAGFEGGQTPLYQRLPKGRGAKQSFSPQVVKPVALRVGALNQFAAEDVVGPGVLRKAGVITRRGQTVKLIAGGELRGKLTVRVHAATGGAVRVVEGAGGTVEIIPARRVRMSPSAKRKAKSAT